MVRYFLIITVLLFVNSGYAINVQLEIYYDGFWTHNWTPKSLEDLKKGSELQVSCNEIEIPQVIKNVLFEGYSEHSGNTVAEHLLYIKLKNERREVKVFGDNDYLYHTGGLSRRLTEKEKILLNNFIKDNSSKISDFIGYRKYRDPNDNE